MVMNGRFKMQFEGKYKSTNHRQQNGNSKKNFERK